MRAGLGVRGGDARSGNVPDNIIGRFFFVCFPKCRHRTLFDLKNKIDCTSEPKQEPKH